MAEKIGLTASEKINFSNAENNSITDPKKISSISINKNVFERNLSTLEKTALSNLEKKENEINLNKFASEYTRISRKPSVNDFENIQLEESLMENQELCTSMHQLLNNFKRETNANTPPEINSRKPMRELNIIKDSQIHSSRAPLNKTNSQHVTKFSQSSSTSAIPSSVMNSPGYLPATRFVIALIFYNHMYKFKIILKLKIIFFSKKYHKF